MHYPVSMERCSACSMCSLVTKDINFAPLPESKQYYQCLAMAEAACGETEAPDSKRAENGVK